LFYTRARIYPPDLAVAILMMTTLLQRGPSRSDSKPGGVTAVLGALVTLGFLTAPLALSRTVAVYAALRWLFGFGAYLVLARTVAPTKMWILALVVGLALQTAVGIGQVIKQGPLALPGEAALEASQPGAAVLTVRGRSWLRPYGLTFHPNVLGGYLAVGLLLLLPLLGRRWMRPLWWLLAAGLLLSFSRSAWLATAVVLPPLSGWLAWRKAGLRRSLAITLGGAAVVGVLLLALLGGQLVSRLQPRATMTEYRSLAERGKLIGVALENIADRPLTGVGAGNFALAVSRSSSPVHPQPVHNVPLLLASEVGLLGGVMWFLLWLVPGMVAADQLRYGPIWSVVLAAAWFAWGIIGLWDHYPWALDSGRLLSVSLLALMTRATEADEPGI
jgi:hypothetical protein